MEINQAQLEKGKRLKRNGDSLRGCPTEDHTRASENPGTMLGTPTFKSGIPEEKRTRHEKILENS